MAYKIKRPVPTYYIPLSDKIEKQLDNEWKAGRSGMISAQQNCPECGASMYFDKGDSHNDPWWECPKGHGTFSKEKLLSKGKGWRENPDHTGKAPEHRKAALKAEGKGAINEPIRVKETTLFEKWVAYLESLDPHGRGFEVFDYNVEEESVSKLNEILKGGQQALDDHINELQELNLEYQDSMFDTSFKEFLEGEDIDRSTIENEDEFRIEFEGHVNYNVEKLFDYDVLLLEKKHYEVAYDGASSEINLTDTEAMEFRKKALKYITEKQLNTILANSYGGVGYFGIIIHASEIIEAIKKGEKSVSDNQLVVGIHDWMNGAGYFERATVKPNYEIVLSNTMLDTSNYGIGGVFGTGEWKWR